MITYEFNFICDGEAILKQSFPGSRPRIIDDKPHCEEMYSEGNWPAADGYKTAWLNANHQGWREAAWKGVTRHLCPSCWKAFKEMQKAAPK